MSLTSRKVFSAEVFLSGLADDPISTDVVAQVEFMSHGRPEQPRDLAGFLAMSVVATLRGCRSAPNHAQPFLDICGEVADALLDCDPAMVGTFSLRHAITEPLLDAEDLYGIYGDEAAATEEMIDCWLRQCLPRVGDEDAGGHRRRFKATLKAPRRAGGVPFVAPWSRNSFLGIQGTLAMFEAATRSRDYQATTRPVAATMRRMLDFNADVFGREGVPGFGEATWLYQLAGAVSVAEDPLTCALPNFSGANSPEEAVMTAKLGRWAVESGLEASAAAREIGRRTKAGEPMPWDDPSV